MAIKKANEQTNEKTTPELHVKNYPEEIFLEVCELGIIKFNGSKFNIIP